MAKTLTPELIWIEGRCYRANDELPKLTSLREYDLYGPEAEIMDDISEEDSINVQKLENGRFKYSFHVPKHYFGSLIGQKGSTKRRIENETRAEIRIPKQGQSGDIVIMGSTANSVSLGWRRITSIVDAARARQRPTHFLSIPMNSQMIVENFKKFKEQVLAEAPRGVDETIFTKPLKLHLTVGVMCLMDDEERSMACKHLAEAKSKIVDPFLDSHGPLKIYARGVNNMADDPGNVHVLFAKVEDKNGVLQKLVDELAGHFVNTGLMKSERDKVTLHMTLMNSANRKSEDDPEDQQHTRRYGKRQTFDCSTILEKYSSYEFGEQDLQAIHISQMHTESIDGYYEPSSVMNCLKSTV